MRWASRWVDSQKKSFGVFVLANDKPDAAGLRAEYIDLLRSQLPAKLRKTFDSLLRCAGHDDPYVCYLETLVFDAEKRMRQRNRDARGEARADFRKLTEERRKTIGLRALLKRSGDKPKDYKVGRLKAAPKPESKEPAK